MPMPSFSYVKIVALNIHMEIDMNNHVAQAEERGFFLRDVKFSEMLVVLIFDKKEHGDFGGPGGWHGGHGGGPDF